MNKLGFLFALLMVSALPLMGQTSSIYGSCEVGGTKIVVQGLLSTNYAQVSYPKCSVKVYLTGTTTLATIYSDKINTHLGNPFTANVDGSWLFYVASSLGYDIVLSGGTPISFPNPVSLTGVIAGGPAGATGSTGPTGPTGPAGPSCAAPGCIVPNPTVAQTVTQADTTPFTFNLPNASAAMNVNTTVSVITPGGNGGTSANSGTILSNLISGLGRNNGNGPGIDCDLNDCGWNVQLGTDVAIKDYKDGIMSALVIDSIHAAAGDTNTVTINPFCPGGNEDASGEGCRVFDITNTGANEFYTGTIGTTQTGSTTPILASGSMVSGSFIINHSKPQLTNTLAGAPAIWNDGSGGNTNNILSSPIGGSGIVTPGICKTTAYMQGDNYLNENLVTRSISCNIINGKALTNSGGPVWQVSTGVPPERVTISSVTTSGSTQTLSVTGRKPAATGSYFFQGGTNGVMVYADDVAKAGVYTAYYIFGAVDSTHLLFGFFDQGVMNRSDPIQTHSVAETYTSAFTVYDAARVSSLDPSGQNPVLEPNTVPFVIGDTAYDLFNPAYNERLMEIISSAFAPADASNGSKGIQIVMAGQGEHYSGGAYRPFEIDSNAPLGFYNCTGCGGWLDAPAAMVISTNQSRLPFSHILTFGQPVDATSGFFGGGCAAGTVLCNINDPTHNFLLYGETNSGRNIEIDNLAAAAPTVDFNGYDAIYVNAVILTGAGNGGVRFPGVADGTYLRCNTLGTCTPQVIRGGDLPLATNSIAGAIQPDGSTTSIASSLLSTVGFSGTCASTTTLTVTKGLITGCS